MARSLKLILLWVKRPVLALGVLWLPRPAGPPAGGLPAAARDGHRSARAQDTLPARSVGLAR